MALPHGGNASTFDGPAIVYAPHEEDSVMDCGAATGYRRQLSQAVVGYQDRLSAKSLSHGHDNQSREEIRSEQDRRAPDQQKKRTGRV